MLVKNLYRKRDHETPDVLLSWTPEVVVSSILTAKYAQGAGMPVLVMLTHALFCAMCVGQ